MILKVLKEYETEFAQFLYYTPGHLDREGQLWPVRAGRSIAKPNYRVGPKRIECFSLHLVLGGRVQFEYAGQRTELQKNDLFCLFPNQTYYYSQLPSESPLQLNWLALDGDRVRSLLELAGLTEARPYLLKAITSRIRDTIESILQALAGMDGWQPSLSLELQALICALFAELVPEAAEGHTAEPAGWIRECIDFMELHATEGITVQQVADFAGVHRSHFSSVFADQVGMPPQKYLQKIRMDKARRLLNDTDATVTEIALSLGYPNLYTFTRAFKSYHKLSPQATRT